MADKLNSNGDVAERDPLREITGFYGHGKVLAFEMCVIDLAEANGLKMLELNQACHFLAMATALRIAQKSKGLEGSDALEAMREMGLLDDDPLAGIMRDELETGAEMPGEKHDAPANPLERAAKGAVRGGLHLMD